MKSTVFNSKARDYALYRPQYAHEAIEAFINLTGIDSTWNVADIGSGTGNVSRHFVDKVSKVFAVEIDMGFIFNPATINRYSFQVVFEEGWIEYIGGIRSASRNPGPGDAGYEEFENKLRKRFDSQSKDGQITVKYSTELMIGKLNQKTGSQRGI